MSTATGFPGKDVQLRINVSFQEVSAYRDEKKILIITDENIFDLHREKLSQYPCIRIGAGEANKTQGTADNIIQEMLEMNIDKSWLIVGVGGGVVTDITGYVASVFKRGISLALVPTTILAMTDAALGGKNGVNVGIYKNMVGTTYRPEFILFDYSFLDTLPRAEWINGFAEIIKHACIKDTEMFSELEQHSVDHYITNRAALRELVEKNIAIKTAVVANDEFETGERYQLNFGHTFGHAIENLYGLPHGHAISIGMVMAAKISQAVSGLDASSVQKIIKLLGQYHLPISLDTDPVSVLDALKNDKKRAGDHINFVLLNRIGEASVKLLSFDRLRELLSQTA